MSIIGKNVRRKPDNSQDIVKIQLTSVIDMMTFLLIFILKSFSTETSIITPSADLQLPYSSSKDSTRPAPMLEVTPRFVLLNGAPAADLSAIRDSDPLILPELHRQLEKAASLDGGLKKEHEIIIQCDKSIDFKYLKRVLTTCAKASFMDFSLVVMQKE
jgi:biopolymer transport protein ExbD